MEFLHPKIEVSNIKSTEDQLIGCAVAHNESFGDNRYSLIRITKKSICIYDKDSDFKMCFSGFKILSVQYIDDEYLYLIIEDSVGPLIYAETLKINKETI